MDQCPIPASGANPKTLKTSEGKVRCSINKDTPAFITIKRIAEIVTANIIYKTSPISDKILYSSFSAIIRKLMKVF